MEPKTKHLTTPTGAAAADQSSPLGRGQGSTRASASLGAVEVSVTSYWTEAHFEIDGASYALFGNVHEVRPAVLTGHPDDMRPASGGEVEDVELYVEKRDQWNRPYQAVVPESEWAGELAHAALANRLRAAAFDRVRE